MFETITNRDSPRAASQAAKTSRIIGIMLASTKLELRIVKDIVTNRDNIMPSKHRSEDIRWDRYISRPSSDTVNASAIFIYVRAI